MGQMREWAGSVVRVLRVPWKEVEVPKTKDERIKVGDGLFRIAKAAS